jgi:hypothetical protein
MLQAFVDDSRSFGAKPVFVLGGYLADIETWLKFNDDWQRALDATPTIKVFKMNHALKKQGEFFHMSKERRFQKIATMRQALEAHVNAEFSIAFRVDQYQAAYAHYPKAHQNPYYFGIAALMGQIARNLENFGFSRQPVDFIFDRSDMEMDKVLAAWKWATETAKPDPDDLLEIMKNPPSFRSDTDALPLQAADMQAVWVRSTFDVDHTDHTPPPMPGAKRHIRGFIHTYSQQELIDAAALTLKGLKKAFDEGRIKNSG